MDIIQCNVNNHYNTTACGYLYLHCLIEKREGSEQISFNSNESMGFKDVLVCVRVCGLVRMCRDSDECVLTDGVTPPKPASTSSAALLSRLNIEVKPPFISIQHGKGRTQKTSKRLIPFEC